MTDIIRKRSPHRIFFETSTHNENALEKGSIVVAIQNAIADWLAERAAANSLVLDVCCGGLWLPIRLMERRRDLDCIVGLDYATNQLRIALRNFKHHLGAGSSLFLPVQADITAIPLAERSMHLIVWSLAIHLFLPLEIEAVFKELRRICADTGTVNIVTYDKASIGQSLCDRYVEGYAVADRKRYHSTAFIEAALRRQGWRGVRTLVFNEDVSRTDYAEIERELRSLPYSTFSIMKKRCGKRELMRRVVAALDNIRRDINKGPITFRQEVAVVTAKASLSCRYSETGV